VARYSSAARLAQVRGWIHWLRHGEEEVQALYGPTPTTSRTRRRSPKPVPSADSEVTDNRPASDRPRCDTDPAVSRRLAGADLRPGRPTGVDDLLGYAAQFGVGVLGLAAQDVEGLGQR